MARVLGVKQGPAGTVHQGIWVNKRGGYSRSEEAISNIDLWAALSNPSALRRGVARDFAAAIAANPGVGEMWLTDIQRDLRMAVALKDPEVEIEIRTTFLDLVCERLDPSEGDLFVFPKGDIPNWAERGERLV